MLVPVICVPRHGHTAEVIGTALEGHAWLGYGHRRLAGLLDVAEATVRGWLRRVDRAAGALYRHGLDLAAVLPWATCPPACPAAGEIAPPTALARALSELAGAARGFTRPRPPAQPVSDTGIDYLHQLDAAASICATPLAGGTPCRSGPPSTCSPEGACPQPRPDSGTPDLRPLPAHRTGPRAAGMPSARRTCAP